MEIRHFIVGGAQRSATTYLSTALSAHPEIRMAEPLRPEPKFFLKPELFEHGIEAYYDNFFPKNDAETAAVYGEKSTTYIESEAAAKKIKSMIPDVKLIFMLRNPIDRAMSNIAFSRMHGFEHSPLDVAIQRELDRPQDLIDADKAGISASPQAYLARGRYVNYLSHYFDIFDSNNIHVAVTENLIGSQKNLEKIYKFLNVDPEFVPTMLNERINQSKRSEDNKLSNAVIKRLETYFAPYNNKLEHLTGLDLSVWN